jgi:molecular chaperone GrpE
MNNKFQQTKNDKKEEINLDENHEANNHLKNDTDKNEAEDKINNFDGSNDITEEKNKTQDEPIDHEVIISELKEEKLRLLAEMENIRKRFVKEKSESIKFGSMSLARDILSINDNLIRALDNIPDDKNIAEPVKNLVDGIKMIQKEFTNILEKHGIKNITALNKKFDHNLHQAMLEIETENKERGIVVQEIQSGYTMHDKLLRPAMVGVSKKPKKNKEKK